MSEKPKDWSHLRWWLELLGFCFTGMRGNDGLYYAAEVCPLHGPPDVLESIALRREEEK